MSEEEFTCWVELPADAKHVVFGNLPHLMALALFPDTEPESEYLSFAYYGALQELEEELPKAVDGGRLKVFSPLSRSPHTSGVGAALKRALVLLPDLRDYLAQRGIGVRVAGASAVATAMAASPAGEATTDRCARLLRWFREEEAKQTRGALARVVKRDGRARQTVSEDIAKARKAEGERAAPLAAMARIVRR